MDFAKKTASEQAFTKLEQWLQRNAITEGSKLPPERQLAEKLNVSRRALREALGRLEADGQIWRGVGYGTVVGSAPAKPIDGIEQPMTVKTLTSPTELMEARLALEPSIAGLAALHATTQDLEQMRRCLKKSAGVTEHTGWDRWDSAFHEAIGEASHNALITALFELLNSARSHTEWGKLREATLNTDRKHLYTRQHEMIVDAIADRDAERAGQHMHTHLQTVKQTLLDPMSMGFNGWRFAATNTAPTKP